LFTQGIKNIKAEKHDAKTEFETKVTELTERSVSIISLSSEDEETERWAIKEQYCLRRITRYLNV